MAFNVGRSEDGVGVRQEEAKRPKLYAVGSEKPAYDRVKITELMTADFARRGLDEPDRWKMRAVPATEADTKTVLSGRQAYSIEYITPEGLTIDYSRDPNFASSDFKPVRWRFLDGGTPKYIQRAGSEVHAYFPPLPEGSPSWGVIAKDTSIKIGLTEGEFCAYVASKLGFPTIGLGGVNSYCSKRIYQPILNELLDIEWRGREVEIPYDSDLAGKPQVARAAGDLALRLSELGARPKLVKIPMTIRPAES